MRTDTGAGYCGFGLETRPRAPKHGTLDRRRAKHLARVAWREGVCHLFWKGSGLAREWDSSREIERYIRCYLRGDSAFGPWWSRTY
jgi:hypothetical protein